MRRFLHLFHRERPLPAPTWHLSPHQREQLLRLLSEIGLRIVNDARGPVPLLTFGRQMLDRLETHQPIPLPLFADALKRVIRDMGHDRLRIMSPSDFVGVGYIYNAEDPETWPVRTSR